MNYLPGIYFFLFILGQSAFPQNKLRITYSYFGITKKYEIFEGTLLNYKVKGNRDFLTSRVVALRDSSIIFESEDAILLNQLKLVRVKKKNYHNRLFQKIFFRGAVGYPLLAAGNNAINGITPLLSAQTVMVSGSLLLAWAILKRLDIKRIRITQHKTLKIIETDYQGLNSH